MTAQPKAVFLSYSSDDAGVARKICDALRAEGIEVWFDESELAGGDAWDQKIRRQIRDCALFVPIISTHTQARKEGYFRLEWRLAEERSQLIAEGEPFLLPVVADNTKERDALVPKSFLNVQWTWLPHGDVPAAFVARVQRVLGREQANAPVPPAPAREFTLRVTGPVGAKRLARVFPWAFVAVLAGVLVWKTWRQAAAPPASAATATPAPVIHATITLPASAPLAPARVLPLGLDYPKLALSPDGTLLVYVAWVESTRTQLFLRRLDDPEPRPLAGTDGAYAPCFSPDGRWIGFLANNKVNKVSVLGGAPLPLCESGHETYSVAWADDNMLYFTRWRKFSRVAATSGTPKPVQDTRGDMSLRFAEVLPASKHILANFFNPGTSVSADFTPIEAFAPATGRKTTLVERGFSPRFLRGGYLVFARGGGLLAAGFDADRCRVASEPVPVLHGVRQDALAPAAHFAVSGTGTLVYAPGGALAKSTPAWVDRNGNFKKLAMPAQTYGKLRLSPDGRRVAILVSDVKDRFWVYDLETGKGTAVLESGAHVSAVWTNDGQRLLFVSTHGVRSLLCSIAADELHREPEILYEFPDEDSVVGLEAWSPDSQRVWFVRSRPSANKGVFALRLDGSRQVETVSTSYFTFVRMFRDEKWLTFTSATTGRSEVYVQRYPDGSPIRISFEGGEESMWSPKGDELFYRNRDAWFVVPVTFEPTFKAGAPREMFRGPFINVPGYSEDIHPDGERFLMLMPEYPDAPVTELHVIVNWIEDLKRRVPVAAVPTK